MFVIHIATDDLSFEKVTSQSSTLALNAHIEPKLKTQLIET